MLSKLIFWVYDGYMMGKTRELTKIVTLQRNPMRRKKIKLKRLVPLVKLRRRR